MIRRDFLKRSGALLLAGHPLFTGLNATSARRESERPLLLAHFMPWYQTPDVSGYWGWHWTMDHFDPTQTTAQGLPEIASHYTPLTGPYDSADDVVLEYQTLLMKLSGIDGVIVDWYGMADFRDYAVLNRSTGRLFEHIKKAGLTFCICYEDQSIKHMVEEGVLSRDEVHAHGQEVMRYLHEQWFSDETYLHVDGRPVLLTFGPQYFKSSSDWDTLFSVVEPRPALVTLDKHMVLDALSSYPWPPMTGWDLNREAVEAYLSQFYRKAQRWPYHVGGAFPAFHDIYQEAGVRASYGSIDALDGEMFRLTMQMALDHNSDLIQLITWNDYGEGTIIEPTHEFGCRYLEMVQGFRAAMPGSPFTFTAEDLEIPLQLFNLRRSADTAASERLDEAVNAILAGDVPAARDIIAGLTG